MNPNSDALPTSAPTVALEASQAQVTTCTVSIQTLRIGNRQLTQAVFKQLPKCDLVRFWSPDTVDFDLAGRIWGWVNFDLGHQDHRNFVVQQHDRLYRAEFWVADFEEMLDESPEWWLGTKTERWYSPSGRPTPPQNVMEFFRKWSTDELWATGAMRDWDDLMDQLRRAEQLFIAA